jgi:hypothetical protein
MLLAAVIRPLHCSIIEDNPLASGRGRHNTGFSAQGLMSFPATWVLRGTPRGSAHAHTVKQPKPGAESVWPYPALRNARAKARR